uniref:Vacuolar protein-sorting-associated protein 25 n=1 Tax=Xiphophorus couchianus TaxID=32473 RepID=A0A3B5L5E9_9TELE
IFEWPWQYNFPPFFTPSCDVFVEPLLCWKTYLCVFLQLIKRQLITYNWFVGLCKFNHFLKPPGKLPVEAIQVVFEELRKKGNLEWLDKNKSRCLVMWRRPEEWGKLIYQWVSKNGMNNSVFTLYELSNGDDTDGEEFHGLEDWMLQRSLQALQTEGKAEIISMDDGKGVKFF